MTKRMKIEAAYEITFHRFGGETDRLHLSQAHRNFSEMKSLLRDMARGTESIYRITATCSSSPAKIDIRL